MLKKIGFSTIPQTSACQKLKGQTIHILCRTYPQLNRRLLWTKNKKTVGISTVFHHLSTVLIREDQTHVDNLQEYFESFR